MKPELVPGADFWGDAGTRVYNLAASPIQQLDWTLVDHLDIQGESFLKAACKTGVTDYQTYVATITSYVRAKDPKIAV